MLMCIIISLNNNYQPCAKFSVIIYLKKVTLKHEFLNEENLLNKLYTYVNLLRCKYNFHKICSGWVFCLFQICSVMGCSAAKNLTVQPLDGNKVTELTNGHKEPRKISIPHVPPLESEDPQAELLESSTVNNIQKAGNSK